MFENPWGSKSNINSQKKQSNFFKFSENDNQLDFKMKHIYLLAGVLCVLWLSTGFFTVAPDEEGVVMRFGKYNRKVMPGLNYKAPSPIEVVEKVSTTRIKKDVIGKIKDPIGYSLKRTELENNTSGDADLSYSKESQMLTGDENIIDMHFYVQWRIADPVKYLFNIKDNARDNIVRGVAESVMRHIVGGVSLSDALSERRLVIEDGAKSMLQHVLDSYGTGINIVSVGILYSYVAPEVRDAYRDVQSAKADREKYINQAHAYVNELIPRAKGQAKVITEGAMAYKEAKIAEANGEAKRFNEIYESYIQNKDITKKKMYLSAMEYIYEKSEKIIIDDEVAKGTLPFLPLNNK